MRTALHFAQHAGLVFMAALAVAVPALTNDAPMGGFVGYGNEPVVEKPPAVPAWDTHGGRRGCRALRDGQLAGVVLVVTQRGETVRMGFDAAWGRGHDHEPANDVWVIGACR